MASPGYLFEEDLTAGPQARVERVKRISDGSILVHKTVNNNSAGKHEVSLHEAVQKANPDGPMHVVRMITSWVDNHDLVLELENFQASLDIITPEEMQPIVLLNVAKDTTAGMRELHNADIINDDIKPANLIFKDKSTRIATCDLGAARFDHEDHIYGYTSVFAAPELLAGIPSKTTQIYSWAVSIEYMCLGAIGPSAEGINLASLLPWVGTDFGNILIACSQHDPASRPSVPKLEKMVAAWVAKRKRCKCSYHILPGGACFGCGKPA